MRWSAADLKHGRLGSKDGLLPKEGTRTRMIYDILVTEKKFKVEKTNDSTAIERLKWTYGLNIRPIGGRIYVCFGTPTEDFALEAQKALDEERAKMPPKAPKTVHIVTKPRKHKPFKSKYDFRKMEIGKSKFMPAPEDVAACNIKFTDFGTVLQKAASKQNVGAKMIAQRVENEGKRRGFIVSRVA